MESTLPAAIVGGVVGVAPRIGFLGQPVVPVILVRGGVAVRIRHAEAVAVRIVDVMVFECAKRIIRLGLACRWGRIG